MSGECDKSSLEDTLVQELAARGSGTTTTLPSRLNQDRGRRVHRRTTASKGTRMAMRVGWIRVAAVAAATVAGAGALAVVAAPASAAGVTVTTRSTGLGLILANVHGRTVYLFTRDTRLHSACGSTCAKSWPRLLTSGAPRAGSGVSQSKLSQTAAHQVTYNGHPLYYFSGDTAPGQSRGQGRSAFGGRWWVVSPQGSAGTGTTITLRQTNLGNVVAGPRGRTLYLLTADTANHTTCYASCARSWPPLITTGKPHAGSGLNSTLLGTALRTNGSRQVTYKGHPLYYFSGDSAAGQTNGQGQFAFGGYWYVVNASGGAVMTTASPVSPYRIRR